MARAANTACWSAATAQLTVTELWPSLLAMLVLSGLLVGLALNRRRAAPAHKRGSVVRDGRPRQRASKRSSERTAGQIRLAGVLVPQLDETKHFKLIGTTGTGKSTAIRELLGCALARGDRAIVADPDGGYLRRFHRRYRGDEILSPFAPHAVRWNLFAELASSYDVEQLASALIPSVEHAAAEEWRAYARTFLGALLRRCHERGTTQLAQLWRLLTIATTEELRELLVNTPALPFLDADNARMFGSIRSVTVSAVQALEHIAAQRGAAFSVRNWVSAGSGVLFIPYQARQIAALRGIIATWLRLAIVEALSQPEGCDQRLWFIVDELDALGAIEGLTDALARLRKFGGRCVLGFQTLAQVSATYGAQRAQTLIENCGTTLILRCSASEGGGTASFASKLIGEREIVRTQLTQGRDRESLWSRNTRRSLSVSQQQLTEPAVLPAEIEQLADLTGYLKGASCSDWLKVRLRPDAVSGRSP